VTDAARPDRLRRPWRAAASRDDRTRRRATVHRVVNATTGSTRVRYATSTRIRRDGRRLDVNRVGHEFERAVHRCIADPGHGLVRFLVTFESTLRRTPSTVMVAVASAVAGHRASVSALSRDRPSRHGGLIVRSRRPKSVARPRSLNASGSDSSQESIQESARHPTDSAPSDERSAGHKPRSQTYW